jgi:hypothetical protein
MPPEDEYDCGGGPPDSLVIRLGRRTHTVKYHPGDTVLKRRSGDLRPPSSCEAGDCDLHGASRRGLGHDACEQR